MKTAGERPYRRKQFWVDRTLQLPFITVMLLVLLLMGLTLLGSVYVTLWWVLRTFDLLSDPTTVALFTTVGLTVTLEVLIVAPLVIIVGVLLTHKVAGPLVRVKAALEQMRQGNFDVHLRLRKGDLVDDVADHVNRLAAALRQRAR